VWQIFSATHNTPPYFPLKTMLAATQNIMGNEPVFRDNLVIRFWNNDFITQHHFKWVVQITNE
jgi:hypothetical protein